MGAFGVGYENPHAAGDIDDLKKLLVRCYKYISMTMPCTHEKQLLLKDIEKVAGLTISTLH